MKNGERYLYTDNNHELIIEITKFVDKNKSTSMSCRTLKVTCTPGPAHGLGMPTLVNGNIYQDKINHEQ